MIYVGDKTYDLFTQVLNDYVKDNYIILDELKHLKQSHGKDELKKIWNDTVKTIQL